MTRTKVSFTILQATPWNPVNADPKAGSRPDPYPDPNPGPNPGRDLGERRREEIGFNVIEGIEGINEKNKRNNQNRNKITGIGPDPDGRGRWGVISRRGASRSVRCTGPGTKRSRAAALVRHAAAGFLMVLAFVGLLALLPEAQAQTTVKMVSNGTGSPSNTYLGTDSNDDYRELAQRFTTGSNLNGYTLSTAAIWFTVLPPNANVTNFVAAIYTNASDRPGTLKYPLPNPSGSFATNGRKDFSAAADSTLDSGTKYWLVLKNDNATDGQNTNVGSTDSGKDSDSLAGWSIEGQRFQRSSRSGS